MFNNLIPYAALSVLATTLHAAEITWTVSNITGAESDISTDGTLIIAASGADGGTANVVDGVVHATVNGVPFTDDFTMDSPSHLDTLNSRASSGVSGEYYKMLQFADRLGNGYATWTFNGLTVGNSYQIQIWVQDNVTTAGNQSVVFNNGGVVNPPDYNNASHASVLKETPGEGSPGQYATGTFTADATTQQFQGRTWTNLLTTPAQTGNTTVNAYQLRDLGVVGPDTNPPTPDPMTFAVAPAADGDSSITMTATTATDDSGVEYYFTETSGNPGGTDSGWQDSPSYTDTGLSPETTYSYTVMARDKSPNQNATAASSPAAQATTDAADSTAPTPDPMTFAVAPAASGPYSITMTATTATDDSGVEYYFTETTGNPGGTDSGWQDSPDYTDDGLSPETTYSYTVTARDKSVAQNTTAASTPSADATTLAEPVGPVLLGGFDGNNAANAPIQHTSAVGNFAMDVSVTTPLAGSFNGGGLTGGALWGNTDLEPDADTTNTKALFNCDEHPMEMVITVTNTSATKDVTLDTLHWVSKRDREAAPNTATISYFSGSLTDPLGTSAAYSLGAINTTRHDYDLSGLLSDRTLAPGETATFKFVTSGDDPAGGPRFRLDNLAISGTFSASDYISWSNTQAWTVGDPGTAGTEDYDGDGLTNDAERIFGLDPMSSNSRTPITTPLDPATGTFSYSRRSQPLTGLNFPVWFSLDLVDWYRDIHAAHTPGTPANDIEIVDVQVNPDLLTESKLFIRLASEPPVTLPAPALLSSWGSNSTITLNFSEELYVLSGNDPSNFTVTLDGGGPIAVTDAVLSANAKTVTLTLASPLGLASTYNVGFSNLTGTTGVPLAGGASSQIKTWDDDPTGIKVFILAGQSNMVGYGKSGETYTELTQGTLRYLAVNNGSYPEYDYTSLLTNPADPANSTWASRSDVKVWWHNGHSGNLGDPVSKGDLGYPFQGANANWIGPEYAFGQIIGDYYDSDDVLIIKTAWGGHNLHTNFRPPSAVAARGGEVGASYTEIFDNCREILENLGTEFPEWSGRGYQIVGFGWHQGTSDKSPSNVAAEYAYNLPDFISDIRSEFGKADLPFVIATTGMQDAGPVEPYPYTGYHDVEKAQLWVAGVPQPANVLTSDTRSFWRDSSISPSTTGFHWNHNAESYFLVGKALADDMISLLNAP